MSARVDFTCCETDLLCAIPDCRRKAIGHTERQHTALQRRAKREDNAIGRAYRAGRTYYGRPCIGCHSGLVEQGAGTDYCRACCLRDQPATPRTIAGEGK